MAIQNHAASDELERRAEIAFEQGEFEVARSLFLQLLQATGDPEALRNLLSAEEHSLRVHLKQLRRLNSKDWLAPFMLAERTGAEEANRLYCGILAHAHLSPAERMRVCLARVKLVTSKGLDADVTDDFMSAWSYAENMGTDGGLALRRGMLKLIAGASSRSAVTFLRGFLRHANFPNSISLLVEKKIEELAELYTQMDRLS